jgi:hypothetical protein
MVSYQGTTGTTTPANQNYYNLDFSPGSGTPKYALVPPTASFVQACSASANSASVSCVFTTNVTANNLIAVFVTWDIIDTPTATITNITATCVTGNLTVADSGFTDTASEAAGATAYGTVNASGSCTLTAHMSTTVNVGILAQEIRGVAASNPLDVYNAANDQGLGSFVMTVSATTTASRDYIFVAGYCTSQAGSTLTAGTSTLAYTIPSSGGTKTFKNCEAATEYAVQPAAGLVKGTFPFTANGQYIIGLMAFRSATTTTIANNLSLSGPATVNAYASNTPVTVGGNMVIGSSATYLAAASSTLTINGSFTNSGTFTHNNGTVVFASTTTSVITGPATFYNLQVTTPGKTVRFHAGTVLTVANVFTVTGSAGGGSNFVTIESDNPGSQWLAHFNTASSSIQFAYIQDSGCDSGSSIARLTGTDIDYGDNNYACWIFITPLQDKSLTNNATGGSGGGSQQSGGGAGGGGIIPAAFVQSAFHTAFSGTSSTATFGSNVTANDLIIVGLRTNGTLSSITSTCVTGNLATTTPFSDGGVYLITMAYGVINSSGSCSVTANTLASAAIYLSIHEVSGLAITNPLDGSSTQLSNFTTASPSSGNITTTQGGDYIFGYEANNNGVNISSAGSGFTSRVNDTQSDFTEDQIQSSAGSIAATFTMSSSSGAFVVGVMAFKANNASNGTGGTGGGSGGGSQQSGGGGGGGGGGASP